MKAIRWHHDRYVLDGRNQGGELLFCFRNPPMWRPHGRFSAHGRRFGMRFGTAGVTFAHPLVCGQGGKVPSGKSKEVGKWLLVP
jgi:hypothetical protein